MTRIAINLVLKVKGYLVTKCSRKRLFYKIFSMAEDQTSVLGILILNLQKDFNHLEVKGYLFTKISRKRLLHTIFSNPEDQTSVLGILIRNLPTKLDLDEVKRYLFTNCFSKRLDHRIFIMVIVSSRWSKATLKGLFAKLSCCLAYSLKLAVQLLK